MPSSAPSRSGGGSACGTGRPPLDSIRGGALNSTIASVAVTGSDLPARMHHGTPAQRHDSISKRRATKVSVSEAAAHAVGVDVAAVLARAAVRGVERDDLAEQPHLLVVEGGGVGAGRRLHRQQGDDLEEVVLHDVAQRLDLVVELAPPCTSNCSDMVICTDVMKLRFQIGSSIELANRNTSRFSTGSLPRKWSMRNTSSSSKAAWSTSLSSRAEPRSRPKGFSTTTLASLCSPTCSRPWITSSNIGGGMAR